MKKLLKVARARVSGRCEDGIGRAHGESVATGASREEGAILILALTYLVAVALIVALLSTWAIDDLNNSSHFRAASSLTLAATDMTDVAIQYIRYNPSISTSQPVAPYSNPAEACWGGSAGGGGISAIPVIDGDQVAVWCSTVWNPLNQLLNGIPNVTRDVTFFACSTAVSVSAISCENDPLLTAEVDFDDYPPAPARSAPIQTLCSVYCGSGMEIASWQWGSSTTGSASGPARMLSFSSEPSDTSAGATTDASVYVTDANTNPVAGDSVTIAQQSGPTSGTTPPVPGINSTNSTLTAVTNSQGIAVFTDINPAYAGNYTLIASDGNGQTVTSTNFVVSMQRDVITPPSAPTDATANSGKTFTPVASDKSGAAITVSVDTTSSGCTLTGGVVKFTAPGTCVLDFNDNGNAIYAPAAQATLSFPVGGQSATQVALTLDTKTPAASATTNVTITATLENSVGVQVPSSGTTTVVLSDIGNGFFSTSKGGASSSALDVTFASGASTATAYFGDENTGPDTISAEYGTTDWGSATLTVAGGAPALVAITPSPSSPAVSSLTNTQLSFQLEDKWGNLATSTGTTTLALSDSGNGFFATSNGVTGAATLNITFASGVGTATAYFGNKTSGSDTITAQNGASAWGTSTVSLVAGVATTAQITLSPTTPPKSTSTSTSVTIQLLDQFGNHVTTSGVSLTLSENPGSSGFFATTVGTRGGTATLALTTNTSGVATGSFGDNSAVADAITVTGPGFSISTPSFNP
jgi:hypothetical protein